MVGPFLSPSINYRIGIYLIVSNSATDSAILRGTQSLSKYNTPNFSQAQRTSLITVDNLGGPALGNWRRSVDSNSERPRLYHLITPFSTRPSSANLILSERKIHEVWLVACRTRTPPFWYRALSFGSNPSERTSHSVESRSNHRLLRVTRIGSEEGGTPSGTQGEMRTFQESSIK